MGSLRKCSSRLPLSVPRHWYKGVFNSWPQVSQQIMNKELTIECIVLSPGQVLSVSEAEAAGDHVEKKCKIITARQGTEMEDAL